PSRGRAREWDAAGAAARGGARAGHAARPRAGRHHARRGLTAVRTSRGGTVAAGGPDRRTLVCRGRRSIPRRRRALAWLATVEHWDVEDHEVDIELEREVVRDVQARVRRSRLSAPEPA